MCSLPKETEAIQSVILGERRVVDFGTVRLFPSTWLRGRPPGSPSVGKSDVAFLRGGSTLAPFPVGHRADLLHSSHHRDPDSSRNRPL